MREILFRGKRVENDRWVEGNLVKTKTGASYILVPSEDLDITPTSHMVSFLVCYSSVGQYTGLTDKNSVKIFEGDVVRNGYSSNLGEFWNFGNVVYVVNDGCFEICNTEERYLKRLTQSQIVLRNIEVVGNIHDNPNLLESEEE